MEDAVNAFLLSATSCQLYGLYQFWTEARKWRSPGSAEIQNYYLISYFDKWEIDSFLNSINAWYFHKEINDESTVIIPWMFGYSSNTC